MSENQLPENPNNESSGKDMQKRIDNMFAGQELPTYVSISEVEAMKNRINELETALAGQISSDGEELKADSVESKPSESLINFSAWSSRKEDTERDTDNRAKNTSRILIVLLSAIVLTLPMYFYWAVQTGAWQIYAIIVGLVFSAILMGVCISLARQNRLELAMELIVVNATFVISLIVSMLLGVGIVLAITQFLVILVVAGQSLSGARAARALLVGFVFSIVTLLIDLVAWWQRISVPALQTAIPLIVAVLILVLGFLAVRQFQNYSLRSKLVVSFVFITIASIIAIGYVTNRVASAQFDQEIGENFSELASRMAREVSDSIHASKLAMDGLVLNKFVQDSVEEANQSGTSNLTALNRLDEQWASAPDNAPMVRTVLTNEVAVELRELQERLPQYAELFITDKYGAVIASTERTSDYYQADEEWWQEAWNDGAGNVYISQPEFDESTGIYAMIIALPIPAHNRPDFVGILRATVNINELTTLLSAVQFGETGRAVLVFPNYQFLTREIGIDLETLDSETALEVFAIQDSYAKFEYDGIPSMVSTVPIRSSRSGADAEIIERLNWAIVIHQDLEEVNQPITATTRGITFTAIGVLIAAGLLALFIGGLFAKPIEDLTAVASQIAVGNLNARADERAKDEIGTLAGTFNRMTAQLKDILLGLEQRVAERTHDLELATEVGRAVSEKVGDLTDLLNESVELIRSRYNLYYTQIYLTDASGRTLVLRAGTGDVGRQLLQRGHRLAVSASSLNSRAASTQKATLVGDTKKSVSFLPNPLLPNTRSELAVPLIVNEEVVGVLDMQSDKPETFSDANVPAFEVLAGQLAIAIQNSVLFDQTEEARSQMEEQARRLTSSGWQDFLNAVDRSETLGYVYSQEEILPLTETQQKQFDNKLVVPIQITGTDVGEVLLAGDENRQWSSDEAEIVQAAMQQVGQHIENLRLLAQAEQYRTEAEQVSRRLTSEGWQEFLRTRKELADGYLYDKNQVQPLNGKGLVSEEALAYPLVVRNESIGKVIVPAATEGEISTQELVKAVVEKLSNHIEGLRLLEQAEQRREELRLNEGRLSTALDIARLGNWEYDVEKDIFTFNDNFYSVFRTSIQEVGSYELSSAEYAQRFVHPEDASLVREEIGLVIQSTEREINKYLEHRAIFPDGTIGHIAVNIHVERDENGKITRWHGANQDITESKTAQEIIASRANQLETVATVSTTASTVLNPDELLKNVVNLTKERFNLYHAHIYLLDENWSTLLLAAGSGDVGKQMVDTGHAIQLDVEHSLVARAARDKQALIVNNVREEKDFLANPLLPDTASEMALPMVVGNQVLGVFDVQSKDVNHFTNEDAQIYTTLAAQIAVALQNARLYQEQAATVTQLRELDKLKSSFLANMSHELRTPLNSILGFTEVMLEGLDGPITPNMDNDLKLINKNGQHLLHLINDVLDMAKIESGKMNLIIEKFNLHEIFDEVISITSPQAGEKKLTLKIDTKSDLDVEINADRTRLRQVMINLVNNALKFTEKGKITIRAMREENNVLISVKDTGIGIPPAHLEAVFQEFTQVDSSTTRKAGGTGLGLPISRKLIEMHGGKLWAESSGTDGEGATFFVFMPIENQSAISEPITRKI